MSVTDRSGKVQAAVATLECDLQLLCLTGVEDKLQEGVSPQHHLLFVIHAILWRSSHSQEVIAFPSSSHVDENLRALGTQSPG